MTFEKFDDIIPIGIANIITPVIAHRAPNILPAMVCGEMSP